MSETHDPWANVRTLRPNPYSHDNYCVASEVDAARAAEAAQHQQEMARLRALMLSDEDRIVELLAERDRLKAALSQITALDFEKVNGRHSFYSGAAMFVKAWLLAYAALSGEGTAKP